MVEQNREGTLHAPYPTAGYLAVATSLELGNGALQYARVLANEAAASAIPASKHVVLLAIAAAGRVVVGGYETPFPFSPVLPAFFVQQVAFGGGQCAAPLVPSGGFASAALVQVLSPADDPAVAIAAASPLVPLSPCVFAPSLFSQRRWRQRRAFQIYFFAFHGPLAVL